jgi:hypothetical protein
LLEPAEELPNAFEKKSTAVNAEENEGVLDATFDLVSAAEAAMCSPSLPGVPYPHRARGDTS